MTLDFLSESKRSLYLNPQVMVLAIDAMLVMLGFGLISPSLSFYLIALEGGIDEPPGPGYMVPPEVVAEFSLILGVMMAAFMATRTLLARYWGGVSDEHGRKPLLIAGLTGYVILLLLFGLARNWIHLILIRAFQGAVSASVWPVAQAALMDIVGHERRGEGLGLYMVVSNVGFIIGPGVGGLLYNFCRDTLQLTVPNVFRVPYFIAAALTLPSVILTYIILQETAPGKTDDTIDKLAAVDPASSEPVSEGIEGPGNVDEIRPHRKTMVHALYIMSAANGISLGLGQPLFQLFLMSKITTDIGLIGIVISGAGGIGMLLSIPAGRYADSHGRKGLAVYGSLASRAGFFLLPLTKNLAQSSSAWIIQGASRAASQPALRAIQADIVPWKLRGKLFGTIQACFNAGATIGPLAGGALFSFFSLLTLQFGVFKMDGVVVPFWIAAAVGVFGAFMLWRYVEETHPVKVAEAEVEDDSLTDAT
ncbi:MAG: MFS transporter [Candidatus Thorarchaeota archaeon]